MGKVVERKKKKKKGRPSLLDLQKRTLREQQPQPPPQPPQPQHQKRNYNSAPHSVPNYRTTPPPHPSPSSAAAPLRRSTRRNPIPDEDEDEEEEEEEDSNSNSNSDDNGNGNNGNESAAGKKKRRREKKLKLVLRLPPSQKSSLNSASLNSCNSDSIADDDNAAASDSNKKRKINAIPRGSDSLKGEKSISGTNPTSTHQGGQLDSGPSTPLPDKKLLLFILDRLQKKDTYGVFSEPVDPSELPDYHEVIEHPMDFGTVRKKVSGGAYATLEQFEKDVFLICSNAMQYNAPDTIYFRQARSIHELAKKNFENLRQDSADDEPEPKIVRRGRPPTKNLKKSLGRPSLECAGSEFSADATLATGGENNWSNDLRKGAHLSDKSALADSSGRFHGSRNNDVYTNWMADNKSERNDEFPGSMMKGYQIKNGKKPFVLDETRRNTYRQSHPSASGREPSVLATFDIERKQLMAVGLHSEQGYARSLARFAANLGPIAWKVASKRIERSLPAGIKFGPGWVGENDVIPQRPLLLPSSLPGQLSPLQPFPVIKSSSSTVTPCAVESKGDDLSEMMPEGNNSSEKHVPSAHSALDEHPSKHLPPSATTSSSLKLNPKSHKNLFFLFSSSSSTFFKPSLPSATTFPLNLKTPSNPIQFHPLSDSIHDNLVEDLENSVNSHIPINEICQITPLESSPRIFIQDPPWIASIFLKGLYKRTDQEVKLEYKEMEKRKYNLLRRRQIKAETEAWERMVEEYRELEREMCEKKLAPTLPYIKALFLGWFEPLRDAIEKEQKMQRTKKHKAAFAPHIDLLPADKMAVIVMHKMMGLFMMGNQEGYVQVVQAAIQVGVAIEQEVRIHSFLEKTKNSQSKKIVADTEDGLHKEKQILRKRVNSLIRKRKLKEAQKLLKKEEFKPWGRDTQAKLGSRLIELLTETAYVQPPLNQSADGPPDIRPAFRHKFKPVTKNPGQKIVKNYGIIECDPLILMGLDKTAKHALIPYVPMLVPPKKWKGYDKGGHLFLPSYVMRTHGSRKQQDAVKNVPVKQMQKVFEALDMLGNTKWRVNRKVFSVVESIWARGGNIAGLVDCEDVPIPEKPSSEDLTEIQEWKWSWRKAKKINLERHSQRCDTELKLSVARTMIDEEGFYYPHNLDFRGRAYPMHPHLNHLSSDLCRGILEFAEGRLLGKSGLHWLKIHLANLYSGGVEKLSHDGRLAFVDNHLDDIFDSADNPVNGNQWWLTAEDPFQFLAACINLSEALRSSSPHTVISHLPIHQDGSCNGLQHYAALGRDSMEAAAVNLTAGDKPADVYSEIAVRVHDIMKRDSNKDPTTNPHALLAKVLIDQVDRKLVKQTVMTSVYGVTYVGAREQIKRRLEEKGLITDDRLLFTAACYAAKVTLAALGEIFEAARGIMGWLGDCAKVIASENQPVRWTTPLGLPVVQPYCRSERHLIRTSLQILALQREGNMVDVRKQRTAFPPNFVHSLDGTHMMMTAVACRDAGLRFAGVHDSFWTHASDVDKMNQILREKFVELYSKPILENLLESFQTSYPELMFPPLPERGDFDLQKVLESPYFFN